jgi:hypothetical protein
LSGKAAVVRWLVVLAAGTFASGCAVPPGFPVPTPEAPRGVPGFDTRDYPGDDVMEAWLESSPYRWVGYYLPSPCYRGTSWEGTRGRLERMGWGIAVLFVGEQDWAEILPAEQVIADPTLPRCTRPNLHGARGTEDGQAAVAAAAADGFPSGTAIYLNVERVERVSSDLRDYARSWAAAVVADGRYLPALYAHSRNADELLPLIAEELASAGRGDEPRLWVATSQDFELHRGPDESGFPSAWIWQGRFDIRETWAGVTLRIDANVARSASPSR